MTTETIPWLDDMHASLGVQETKSKGSNPKIKAYFADCGHDLEKLGDDSDVAWCGARVGSALKRAGFPIPPKANNLLARSYTTYGIACEPKPGAIGIIPRGKSGWQGHVFVVEEIKPDGTWVTIGGNQGPSGFGKVSRAIVDPKKTEILATRWPVAATVPDLRGAGSTEIKKGDGLQKWGIFTTFLGPIIAAIKELLSPVTQVPKHADIGESLSYWQQTLEAANAVAKIVLDNPWLAGAVFSGLCMAWIGNTIKKHRVAKAEAGVPLSAELET
jgi:uncharacterized protein (TIGR02594 family)